uniref:Uncharacterized protein n=1 Tax=Oryza nivara TaxID=4536 RepID=A0A0E0GQS4_ORYNI
MDAGCLAEGRASKLRLRGGRAVSDLLPELVSVHERTDPRVVEAEKAPQGCQNVGRKWLVEGLDVGRDCRVIDWFTRLEVCHLLGKPNLCPTRDRHRGGPCRLPVAPPSRRRRLLGLGVPRCWLRDVRQDRLGDAAEKGRHGSRGVVVVLEVEEVDLLGQDLDDLGGLLLLLSDLQGGRILGQPICQQWRPTMCLSGLQGGLLLMGWPICHQWRPIMLEWCVVLQWAVTAQQPSPRLQAV